MWSSTICQTYTGSTKGKRLTSPLGEWLPTHDKYRFWYWQMPDETQLLYRSSINAPTRIAMQIANRRTWMKFSPTVPTNKEFKGPPITPSDIQLNVIPLPVIPLAAPHPVAAPPLHFLTIQNQFRHDLLPWQRILFGSLRKAYTTNTLYGALQLRQSLIIVSDASVQKDGQSGFAWVIAQEAQPLWRGMGLAPGPVDDMYSGRAEAFGVLAAILFLQYYISCFPPDIHPLTIRCFCDNMGVITNLREMQQETIIRPNDTTADDRDIYLAILAATKRCSPIKITYAHVKGHQDRKPDHPLTTEELHNVECDKLAKAFVCQHRTRSTQYNNPEMEEGQPHLTIADKVICRRFIPALRRATAEPAYQKYLCKRLIWTYADYQDVHWEILKTALNAQPRNDQHRLTLFLHGKLPLRTSKFHPHLGSELCPSCRREPEDDWHFLECPHQERRTLFNKLKQTLAATTTKHQIHPSILTTFWLGLLAIRQATPYPNIQADLPPILRETIRRQSRLGWEQLYQGRLS